MGYHDVRHYAGGIVDWVDHNGPVEAGAPPALGPRLPAVSAPGPRRPSARTPRDWLPERLLDALATSSFGTLLAVWLGLVFGSGVVYWLLGLLRVSLLEGSNPVQPTLEGLGTAIYFSFITATSVGYGDVIPVGPARALAVLESTAGLLIVGCVISKLVSRRQEQLVEETHMLAFEDRLGRVRTNLHLVLSELQKLSGECVTTPLPREHVLPRLQSTAVIFAGELRAVHDLLYRPQHMPEEVVLETVLAILTAGLEGLSSLLECLPAARESSRSFKATLGLITTLAGEICGNCVPREYAPELRVWMDRIQELAHTIAAPLGE